MTSLKKLSDEIKKSKDMENMIKVVTTLVDNWSKITSGDPAQAIVGVIEFIGSVGAVVGGPCGPCLLYTSPSPRDKRQSRMPSSA